MASGLPLPRRDDAEGPVDGDTQGESRNGLSGQGAPRYATINWREFRMKRFAGDYADEGVEDVQISHFRLSPA